MYILLIIAILIDFSYFTSINFKYKNIKILYHPLKHHMDFYFLNNFLT